jgi:hypothetical protein
MVGEYGDSDVCVVVELVSGFCCVQTLVYIY